MKIGILTQPLHNNYGGLLQNYALQQILIGMGHKVETIDWDPFQENPFRAWIRAKRDIMLSILMKERERPRYQLNEIENKYISKNTSKFINRYINVCPQKAQKLEDFQDIEKRYLYDGYVVGSDQVWRPNYNIGMMPAMFLHFVERYNVKRIAYAASFGTSSWEFSPDLTKECSVLAKRFDLITVRETSGVELCKRYLGVEAKHVLDPTMLLDKEDYVKLVELEKEPQSSGNLFYYILDPSPEKKTLIENIAARNGLEPFTVMPKCQAENRTKWDVKNRIDDCVFPTVTSWLRGFMDAKMVVVDSFHGAVFSIIFNKPFWVIGNKKRGNARFESVMKMLGLEDRVVTAEKKCAEEWKRPIDWVRVNKELEQKRFLCTSILQDLI